MHSGDPITLDDEIEGVRRAINHLNGDVRGKYVARERQVEVLEAVVKRLEQVKADPLEPKASGL